MCVSPVLIKNPNLGIKNFITTSTKDTVSQYISVPCGVCASCLGLRQTYWLERAELESMRTVVYFCTLTYMDSMLPKTRVYEHLDGGRRRYSYPDYRDIQLMFKRLRKFYLIPPGTKYIVCSEYGGGTHRPHFHMLLFIPKVDGLQFFSHKSQTMGTYNFQSNKFAAMNAEKVLFSNILHEWRRNISGSTKKPVYKPLCRYVVSRDGRRTYDFRLVEGESDRQQVCKYVTKYILKFDKWLRSVRQAIYNNLTPEDYIELWDTIKTKMGVSRQFALGEEFRAYVEKAYEYAEHCQWLLKFRDTVTGKMLPLSKYLANKYLDHRKVLQIFYNRNLLENGLTPFDDYFVPSIAFKAYVKGDKHFVEKNLRKQEFTRNLLNAYNLCDTQFFIDHG